MSEIIKWDYRLEIRKPITKGSLLIAEPFMADPYFGRSVILVTNHEKEDGTVGFILNKCLFKKVSNFVDDFPDFNADIFYGGPVATDTLHYIHNNKAELDGAKEIGKHVFWGGDFETLKNKIEEKVITPKDIRFFVGYSGWDEGQLRKEIINNSWIVGKVKNNYLQIKNQHNLWNTVLTEMGGIYKTLANFPEDPSLN